MLNKFLLNRGVGGVFNIWQKQSHEQLGLY